jgi:hypothetical protein
VDFASIRVGVGLALIGAVVGELLGANRGLGWYVEQSASRIDVTGVFTGLIVRMVAVLVAAALLAPREVTVAAAAERIKIGLVGTNESQLPIRLAIDQGFFRQQDIDVETIEFRGGGIAIQAFVGGSIDLCTCATDH